MFRVLVLERTLEGQRRRQMLFQPKLATARTELRVRLRRRELGASFTVCLLLRTRVVTVAALTR